MYFESGYVVITTKWVNKVYEREPFSLVNDGSSDTWLKKINAVAVNIFDVNQSKKVERKSYDMCVTTWGNSGKAENLFYATDSTVKI